MDFVLTALSIEVEQRRRDRSSARGWGLAVGRLFDSDESFLLAIPGWPGDSWRMVDPPFPSGKDFGLNRMMVGFSFLGTVVGSMPA